MAVTKYLDDAPFGTGANSDAYRDNYDRIFRKRKKADPCARAADTGQCDQDDPCPDHGCTDITCLCSEPRR